MVSPEINFFNEEILLFLNEFNFDMIDYIISTNNFHFLDFFTQSNLTYFNVSQGFFYSEVIIEFINQLDDLNYYKNLENMITIYHYSIPNVKLMYPEPFIASASFMHNDLWFIHILIYQYWLWFVFIFLIIFFFLTFITVIRWCNLRTKPRRETRGVSRSKCGDLVTACVPVSWATSIIVNESTDAIDFFDGFGTTELVIGIRAYQWGWEYYYPKDIDLNYNIKKNFSTFVGNSVKYNYTPSLNYRVNSFYKFYQNKINDSTITPAHLLLFSVDNQKLINFFNSKDIGLSNLDESSSFKKIKTFFKINKNSISYSYNFFNKKFIEFNKIYLNDNFFYNSNFFNLKRQHNFLNNLSIVNNNLIYLNINSLNKLFNFNLKFNFNINSFFQKSFYYNFKKEINFSSLIFNSYFNEILLKNLINYNFIKFNKFINYKNIISYLNNNSDKKSLNYLNYKFFNKKFFNKKFFNLKHFSSYNIYNESNLFYKNNINNIFKNVKNFNLFSSNQSILSNEKSLKKFVFKVNSQKNYNLNYNLNYNSSLLSNYNSQIINLFSTYINSKFKYLNHFNYLKLISKSFYSDYPSSPIFSNNIIFSKLDYDSSQFSFIKNLPIMLQTKEDNLPSSIPNIYWNFYLSNSDLSWRLENNLKFFTNVNLKLSFPIFSFYYDYDFKNWQNILLLENAVWDSSYLNYYYDDYNLIFSKFYNFFKQKEYNKLYNLDNKKFKFFERIISKTQHSYNDNDLSYYPNFFYIDNSIFNFNLLNTNNFFFFPLINFINENENIFEIYKNYFIIFNLNNLNLINFSNFFYKFYASSFILNSFKSNYEYNYWINDFFNFNNIFFEKNNYSNILTKFNFFLNIKNETNLINKYSKIFANFYSLNITDELSNFFYKKYNFRLNSLLDLRNTSKNSITTFNALQKVFKSRFDENRSNAKIFELSNSFENQPLLTSNRTFYEGLLGKNKTNFFKTNFFKTNFFNFFNQFSLFFNSNNLYIYEFPFLLSYKSDSSKYLWFDWFSRWNFYEVQPSSSSKYSIHGMPYYNKFFDFTTSQNDMINESETYLSRIERARKNYLPNWVHTPYFFLKKINWYKNDLFFKYLNEFNNSLITLKFNLDISLQYWLLNIYDLNTKFSPSNSNLNSFSRSSWKPTSSISSYYYNISNLIDILTKREFLYRQFFLTNNKLVSLPIYLTNNPKNQLLLELKSIFNYTDSYLINNEYSKNIYFNILNKHTEDFYKNLLNDKLTYFFSKKNFNLLKNNDLLYKNQSRPLKKGINNMLRLHATGAIAMPIEIRLQILASSKDVIHSWAIPSAGIKIDCVPGYSSHKVVVFLVSGIFWGQCMEICGRYHHWMPIVVYFMKRDLFFLWCTHFVFNSNNNNLLQVNDRQNTNLIKTVSVDKNSWLSELI